MNTKTNTRMPEKNCRPGRSMANLKKTADRYTTPFLAILFLAGQLLASPSSMYGQIAKTGANTVDESTATGEKQSGYRRETIRMGRSRRAESAAGRQDRIRKPGLVGSQ